MLKKYFDFVRGASADPIGKLGVALVTSSFVTFVFFELARLTGILENAYVGLITYLLFPSLFMLGLILIPIGWRRLKKQTGKSTRELIDSRFGEEQTKGGFLGSKFAMSILALTLLNVLFLSAASSRMLSFMDEAEFCGTACHSVMNPEWVTYQQSSHARVKCVECHVGEGAGALLDSKLNGIWQMVSVTFDLLERPIPTPVRQLRPARETCEKCHWPEKFYGSRLKTIVHYEKDSASTPRYTNLNLKVDAGEWSGEEGPAGGIHWHIAKENQVRYVSVNDERREMIWVEALLPDGSFKRFTNRRATSVAAAEASSRTMDCVDCHNRATHVYENPQVAIDTRIRQGLIDRSLPFIKREALAAVMADYPTRDAAMEGIAYHLGEFYRQHFAEVSLGKQSAIDSAVAVVQNVYNRNVHPEMNITWGTYRSHIGHVGNQGCFRCHNQNLVDEGGTAISSDCSLCHSILASDSETPFEYLQPADTSSRDYLMHKYLRDEFLDYVKE